MRYITIEKIPSDSFSAKPLYNDSGIRLIKQGARITETLLKKLRAMNYVGLYIEDELSNGIIIDEVVDEGLRLQASDTLKSVLEREQDYTAIFPVISELIDSVVHNRSHLIQVNHLQNYNEYLHAHCVNVAVLSVRIGLEFDLPKDKLFDLAVAGIFHDVGKVRISEDILNKKDSLTVSEFEEMKMHSEFGYEMAKKQSRIAISSRVAIMDHHERLNGGGYPKGLKGNEISGFGKILGVADTYDAMTTDRSYRGAISAADVIEYLTVNAETLFDFEVIKAFTRCTAVYPTGSIVQLTNGKTAIVVKNYNDCVTRPYIRLTDTKDELDLREEKYSGLSILKVV